MEERVNTVAFITRILPRFDGTKPENYRDWYSKTRAVLSLSNQDVFDVLNGLTEQIPVFPNTDTMDIPTNLAQVIRWKRACENLLSSPYLITSGPAAIRSRRYEDRTSGGALGNGQQALNALCA